MERGCRGRDRRAALVALSFGIALVGAVAAGAQRSGEAVLYGDTFLLSGTVEREGAGRVVVVLARPHGRETYKEVTRVRTTAGGRWRYTARPAIRTLYRARIGQLRSTPVAVDVEPRITLRGSGGRFSGAVRAARSFAGKFVVLQRRTSGPWRDVRRLVLDGKSATTFGFAPSSTRTQIRLVMPASQVGPGYVPARSPVITLLG
jgi:hypothetical protein